MLTCIVLNLILIVVCVCVCVCVCVQVTCCECVCSGQVIVSGGSAGVVSFWSIHNTHQQLAFSGGVTHLRGHEGQITCLAACRPYSIVVTGSVDKTCIIWDTNRFVIGQSVASEGLFSVHEDLPEATVAVNIKFLFRIRRTIVLYTEHFYGAYETGTLY